MHREKPHKLLQVGVTPTPATNLVDGYGLDCGGFEQRPQVRQPPPHQLTTLPPSTFRQGSDPAARL